MSAPAASGDSIQCSGVVGVMSPTQAIWSIVTFLVATSAMERRVGIKMIKSGSGKHSNRHNRPINSDSKKRRSLAVSSRSE